MTSRRLVVLLAALAVAVAAVTIFSSDSDNRGLLGRFGIGPPPK